MENTTNIKIYNEDCISGSRKYLSDNSIDLLICDPPFGLNESTFNKHYARDDKKVIPGYVEAPSDYKIWTLEWITEAYRVLKTNGTLYIFISWNHLYEILDAVKKLKMLELNHCIWKYNFGVYTTKRFVSSHYHILRLSKSINVKFNTYCRFGNTEKTEYNKSKVYQDLEDVFIINKEFKQGETKNINKLPNELIRKLILYSSDPGDLVGDFFLGNFTTAYVSLGLGRNITGFEINSQAFNFHYPQITNIELCKDISNTPEVKIPINKGKKITPAIREDIIKDYLELKKTVKYKKDIVNLLMERHQRGKFSIINILKTGH
jgi:site-specific DNA-methyltransferase (adenine-specific)